MADLYDNYLELAAAQTEGVDYTRTATPVTQAGWSSIAIHGGGIEPGTGELAQSVAGTDMSCYVFAGIKAANNIDLHLDAATFDEPTGVDLVAATWRTLSFHGFTGTVGVAETAVTGRDATLVAVLREGLQAAGFTVTASGPETSGDSPANICNRNGRGAGVQLELSQAQLEAFFPGGDTSRTMRESGDRTPAFWSYVDVVRSVLSPANTGAQLPESPLLPLSDYLLLVTDRYLNVLGDPIACWTSLDVTLRFNEPGSGMFVAPGYPWIREQLAPGNRVVVLRNYKILISGPIEKWIYERSDDGENAGDGTLTVNFADDLALIVAHLAYPNPALTPATQTTDAWTYTGNAETALRTLVNLNAGEGALAERRVPQLKLGTTAGVGTTITSTAERMEQLGPVMRRIAANGGNLGFRTRQDGAQILFEVYQPQDKSFEVVFSFGNGNLKYVAYEVTAPTATAAIVGGQGEGADRFLTQRVNDGGQQSWGRMEVLVSRPGNDPIADLNAAGDEALADGAETARLPTSTSDTSDQRYGTHYDLGTKVSVESWPGSMVSDLVTTVHIQAWASAGEYVSSTVGSQAATADPAWLKRLRQIDQRVGYLERNMTPAVVTP